MCTFHKSTNWRSTINVYMFKITNGCSTINAYIYVHKITNWIFVEIMPLMSFNYSRLNMASPSPNVLDQTIFSLNLDALEFFSFKNIVYSLRTMNVIF